MKGRITVGTNTNLKTKNDIYVMIIIANYVTPILAFVNVHLFEINVTYTYMQSV